jgi:hypothetical protein
MDLDNIQKARDEFADRDKRYVEAFKHVGDIHTKANMDAWRIESKKLHEEYVAICMKYFGEVPETEDNYIEPSQLLDIIEHFMKAA